MVASTDIKYYVHTNTNAPQLTNNFGCMIDALDACLVNGFGSQTVSALTVSGTTVTASFGAAHNFMQYQVIEIAGATQTEYNGEHRILTVPNANTITFELAAAPSVSTATGTITCSLPPLGWLKPFSGTGKAAYRSSNTLLASRPYLRVVDALDPAYTATYAKYAKVGIVEDMTDIDTMLGVQAPYDSANPNKNWVGTGSGTSAYNGWAKWFYAFAAATSTSSAKTVAPGAGNRSWVIVGSKDYFYILLTHQTSENYFILNGFGNFESCLKIENANTFLAATNDYTQANAGASPNNNAYLTYAGATSVNNSGVFIQRKYDQSASYAQVKMLNLSNNFTVNSGVADSIANKTIQGSILLFPVYFAESNNVVRGKMRGLNWLYQQLPYTSLLPFNDDGKIFLPCSVIAGGFNGQVVFELGAL